MNISEKTLTILKNFSSISKSIIVEPGHVISSFAENKMILATAEVDEEFDTQWAIYDLNQFLSIVSLFKKPNFIFNKHSVEIENDKDHVEYFYGNPELMKTPPTPKMLETDSICVNIPADTLKRTLQAAAVLNCPHWCIDDNGSKLEIVVTNAAISKNTSHNHYRHDLGESVIGDRQPLKSAVRVDNLKMIPQSYDVEVLEDKLMVFKNSSDTLRYHIVQEAL